VQALEAFFAELPPDSGMAFVVVQHLDSHHESLMNSLLSKQTQMHVNDAKEGIRVEPNQVYIKAPGKDIVIRDRKLHFQDPQPKGGIRLPIDTFFRSLAEDMKEKAICILLSGASNDGTLGAKLKDESSDSGLRI
jgi:two-component system CheB/CheR fusion protein